MDKYRKEVNEDEEAFKADRAKEMNNDWKNDAVKELEIETEHDKDAQGIYERSLEMNKKLIDSSKDEKVGEVYHGQNNYQKFIEKKGTAQGNASSGFVRRGPIRAPTNVRATVRWDYEPDLCKDFKETGVCGYGSSCKFMHDRTDYKFGWQLEREYNEKIYGKEDADADRYLIQSSDEQNDDEFLPFRCFICRESFTDPIMTKCGHYFCEKCALTHHREKSRGCFVCGQNTEGIFNPAKALIAKLKGDNGKKDDVNEEEEDEFIEYR
ncbi:hypothetical protein SNEBB_010711 [Seison nebaliae]|nr:hypothetical protein SNEBB_010711 [Seison nebaliae]